MNRIFERAERLEDFPLLGTVVPEYKDESIRELIERPYRIAYENFPDRIDITAVCHGAKILRPEVGE